MKQHLKKAQGTYIAQHRKTQFLCMVIHMTTIEVNCVEEKGENS